MTTSTDRRRSGWFDPTESPLTAFTESLLLGLLWFVLALPVMSLGPATITVLAIRRRQRAGYATSVRQGRRLFLGSWRVGGLLSAAVVLLGGGLLFEIHVALAGGLPGGAVLGRVLMLVLIGLLTAALMIAAQATSGTGLWQSSTAAVDLCLDHPARSLGLFGGVAAITVICVIQPALVCFAAGPLLYAADVLDATSADDRPGGPTVGCGITTRNDA